MLDALVSDKLFLNPDILSETSCPHLRSGLAFGKFPGLRDVLNGFAIYQGGVPIGKELRIVDITGIDVEACGGTHLDNTKEAEKIKILKATKISDSVVRIEFVAGKKAFEEEKKNLFITNELAKLLNCKNEEIPGRLQELFNFWKDVVKKGKKLDKFGLKSKEVYSGDIIEKSVEILKTQPEYLVNTINRFMKEIKDKK